MRVVNRVASASLGVVLVAGGLLVAVNVALIAAGHGPWLMPLDRWHARLTATTVGNRWVLAASIVVGVVGLAVLVAQLRPWRPYRLLAGDTRTVWWLARPSVERRLAAAADAVSGVADARATVRGRERRWRVRTWARAMPDRDDLV